MRKLPLLLIFAAAPLLSGCIAMTAIRATTDVAGVAAEGVYDAGRAVTDMTGLTSSEEDAAMNCAPDTADPSAETCVTETSRGSSYRPPVPKQPGKP